MVELSHLPGRPPIARACDTPDWLAEHRDALRAAVTEHGAVLVRGLGLRDAEGFAAAAACLAEELMVEREPFAPRTPYPGGVYSSTLWPPDQPMCMHHELSYGPEAPSLQMFCCLVPSAEGGATALADAGAVLRDLPAELVDRFERTGWQLLRAHNDVVGVPWQEAFGTDDPATVERYCRDNDIHVTWDADGGLRTRRSRPAIVRHPVTGRRIWFNQVAFLNEWTMEPEVRDYLTFAFGPDGLPFTTRYGEGEPLDRTTVDLINDVYADHTVREPWQAGDLLLVDNIRMAHSRDPYTGRREVLVALADPVRTADLPGVDSGGCSLVSRSSRPGD